MGSRDFVDYMTPLKISERKDLIEKLKVASGLLEISKEMADVTGHEMEVDRIAVMILAEVLTAIQEAAELPFC